MASANKLALQGYGKTAAVMLASIALLSCTLPQPSPSQPGRQSVALASRDNLLQWHDATHKAYYGLKGPVNMLVVEPVELEQSTTDEPLPQEAMFTWQLQFNQQGRLLRRSRVGGEALFETVYEYRADGKSLQRVVSYYDGKPWRSSEYMYKDDMLTQVAFRDHSRNDRFAINIFRQPTAQGWFEIQVPLEKIDLPVYNQFHDDGMLVWSSKGGVNNGLGDLYTIATVDNVVSSSVLNRDTAQMAGQGGYRYRYDDAGLLVAVESYSAHGNALFHTTAYEYNDLQLLVSERTKVTGESVFNEAADAAVDYRYRSIDQHGNWLQRTLTYQSGVHRLTVTETRSIRYFAASDAENAG